MKTLRDIQKIMSNFRKGSGLSNTYVHFEAITFTYLARGTFPKLAVSTVVFPDLKNDSS